MAHFKHLSLSDRVTIQSCLANNQSLASIARLLGRDHRTIAREVLVNRTFIFHGALGRAGNNCANLQGCRRKKLCERCISRRGLCALCGKCNQICPDFVPALCSRIEHPPYCCNGCHHNRNCSLKRFHYFADKADTKAAQRLSDARSGFALSPAQIERTDQIVSPLIRNGQSIHHIYFSHRDELFCSEKTLYSLVDSGLLSVRNLDLPRKPQRKLPRKKPAFKVDRLCRLHRSFDDCQLFLAQHPDLVATQMDSVLPSREGSKVLLTLFWPQAQFLLAFLRDHNTARSVTAVFDHLDALLGRETFLRLFPLILTDNGSEFSDPSALERDDRTRVFYCDPLHSNQKSPIERAHEFIRAVLPKSSYFDRLTQNDCDLLCSHVNSYRRDSLQGKSPFDLFSFLFGDHILNLLGILKLNADEVNLTPRLLGQPR
jgi:IS30 family transposase